MITKPSIPSRGDDATMSPLHGFYRAARGCEASVRSWFANGGDPLCIRDVGNERRSWKQVTWGHLLATYPGAWNIWRTACHATGRSQEIWNARDIEGYAVGHIAAKGDGSVLRAWIDDGGDIQARTMHGRTIGMIESISPESMAVWLEACHRHLDGQRIIHAEDVHGRTVAFHARDERCVEQWAMAGGSMGHRDHRGKTCVEYVDMACHMLGYVRAGASIVHISNERRLIPIFQEAYACYRSKAPHPCEIVTIDAIRQRTGKGESVPMERLKESLNHPMAKQLAQTIIMTATDPIDMARWIQHYSFPDSDAGA
jgi:hypothetical protein